MWLIDVSLIDDSGSHAQAVASFPHPLSRVPLFGLQEGSGLDQTSNKNTHQVRCSLISVIVVGNVIHEGLVRIKSLVGAKVGALRGRSIPVLTDIC